MSPILYDSSIYVAAMRRGDEKTLKHLRLAADVPLWLSAVVLEELYAGANHRNRHIVEQMERDFERAEHMVVPNLADWAQVGKVLARVAMKYGYEEIGRGRLTNDALIAMSAGRLGIRVITSNERDFRRLAKFSMFQWEIMTV